MSRARREREREVGGGDVFIFEREPIGDHEEKMSFPSASCVCCFDERRKSYGDGDTNDVERKPVPTAPYRKREEFSFRFLLSASRSVQFRWWWDSCYRARSSSSSSFDFISKEMDTSISICILYFSFCILLNCLCYLDSRDGQPMLEECWQRPNSFKMLVVVVVDGGWWWWSKLVA